MPRCADSRASMQEGQVQTSSWTCPPMSCKALPRPHVMLHAEACGRKCMAALNIQTGNNVDLDAPTVR